MAHRTPLIVVAGKVTQLQAADTLFVTDSLTVGGVGVPSSALDLDGAFTVQGIAAPAVAPADAGRIYFDTALSRFRVSEDGSSYIDLVATGNVSGTGVAGQVPVWDGVSSITGYPEFTWSTGTDTLTVDGSAEFTSDVTVSGNLTVTGTTTTVGTQHVLVSDNHMFMNNGYTSVSAETGGLVVNYFPTATTTTVAGSYAAGVPATSNPTVQTTGAATFAANDLVQISAGNGVNAGLYEVVSHATNILTVRGIGVTACVEDFTQNQFAAQVSDGAVITKVNVAVLRAGIDGAWEAGSGSATPIVFTDLGTGTGNVSGNGVDNQVAVFSGASSLDGSAEFTWDGTTLGVDGAADFNVSANAAANLTFTTANYKEFKIWGAGNGWASFFDSVDIGPLNEPNGTVLDVYSVLPNTAGGKVGIWLVTEATGATANYATVASVDITGYTGTYGNYGIDILNGNDSTGTDTVYFNRSAVGLRAQARGDGTGTRVGVRGEGMGAGRNFGVVGSGYGSDGTSTNVGVLGVGFVDTTEVAIGGYFTLSDGVFTDNANINLTPAALIADNYTSTAPIFIARDNNTDVFSIRDGTGGIVVNEVNADRDLRVEGVSDPNLFFIDASTNRAGFGTNLPGTKVDVQGAVDTALRVKTTANFADALLEIDRNGQGNARSIIHLQTAGVTDWFVGTFNYGLADPQGSDLLISSTGQSDGSAQFAFGKNGRFGIGMDAPGAAIEVDNLAAAVPIIIAKDNGSPVFSVIDGGATTIAPVSGYSGNALTITGGSITAGQNALYATMSMDTANTTSYQSGVLFEMTPAGSDNKGLIGFIARALDGTYTGTSAVIGAGIGNFENSGYYAPTAGPAVSGSGMIGAYTSATGTGAAPNVGLFSKAENSTNENYGIIAQAYDFGTPVRNTGIKSLASTSATYAQGGYFGLTVPGGDNNAEFLMNVTSALVADNGNTASTIFTAADNNIPVFRIIDGGAVEMAEITAPGTPAAGFGRLYSTSESRPFWMDDSGVEHVLTLDRFQTISWAATTNLDMAPALPMYRSVSITGDTTFTTSNRGNGRGLTLRVVADGTTRNLTFPAGWTWMGGAAPPSLAAGDVAVLTIGAFGTADTDVVATWIYENMPVPISGTGVDNQIAVWSGTYTQDGSAGLIFDGTNLNIGDYSGATAYTWMPPGYTTLWNDDRAGYTYTGHLGAGSIPARFSQVDLTANGDQVAGTYMGYPNAGSGYLTMFANNADVPTTIAAITAAYASALVLGFGATSGSVVERQTFTLTETVVNEPGGNYDFRVEGDTEPNLIFVDASTNRVGFGTSTPASTVDIAPTSGTANVLFVTATMPSAAANPVVFSFTGTGTTGPQIGVYSTFAPGYTGTHYTTAIYGRNNNRGTGTTPIATTGGDFGFISYTGADNVSTSGHRVGVMGRSYGSDTRSYGVIGTAVSTSTGESIGVLGSSLVSGSTVPVGGMFTMNNWDSDTLSIPAGGAVLIADNRTSTVPIFLARDGSSTVFSIIDGGAVEMAEITAPGTPASGFGRLYTSANKIYFINDGGTTYDLTDTGGGGTITGTGSDNQLAVWSGASALDGSASLTWDGTTFGADGAVVFNNSQADRDFRVASDTQSHALFLDAGADGGDGRWGFFDSTPDAKVDIEGGVLPSTVPVLRVAGILSTTAAAQQEGIDVVITSATTTNNAVQRALNVTLEAGYTGSYATHAAYFRNSTAGTGNTPLYSPFAASGGNTAVLGYAEGATTTGSRIGTYGISLYGSGRNFGAIGGAFAGGSAEAIGVYGTAALTSGTPVTIGGMFTLYGATDTIGTLVNAALIADNAATTDPPLLVKDNGTTVFQVIDGGETKVGTGTTGALVVRTEARTVFQSTAPATITANENNYDPGNGSFFTLTSDASRNITGLANGSDGRMVILLNTGSNNIVLTHNDTGNSTSGNCFFFSSGSSITLGADDSIMLIYATVDNRWHAMMSKI